MIVSFLCERIVLRDSVTQLSIGRQLGGVTSCSHVTFTTKPRCCVLVRAYADKGELLQRAVASCDLGQLLFFVAPFSIFSFAKTCLSTSRLSLSILYNYITITIVCIFDFQTNEKCRSMPRTGVRPVRFGSRRTMVGKRRRYSTPNQVHFILT